jgi:hypothetical protein
MRTWFALSLGCILSTGCTSNGPGDAGSSDAQDTVTLDVVTSERPAVLDANAPDGEDALDQGNPTDVQTACGACGAQQICVVPCCGGTAPPCIPADDGGSCTSGTSYGPCYSSQGASMGCYQQCVPAPPHCEDVPAGCDPTHLSNCQFNDCYPGEFTGNSEIQCVCA